MNLTEKLDAAGFATVAAQNPRFQLVHRGRNMCLVETATGQPGAAMRMTGSGLATLIWRESGGFFIGRGFEEPATDDQIADHRAFAADLAAALA